eukprot:jgi/Chlat1/3439/Chrsp23S03756
MAAGLCSATWQLVAPSRPTATARLQVCCSSSKSKRRASSSKRGGKNDGGGDQAQQSGDLLSRDRTTGPTWAGEATTTPTTAPSSSSPSSSTPPTFQPSSTPTTSSPSSSTTPSLPPAPRERVLIACAGVSGALASIALIARQASHAGLLFNSSDWTQQLPLRYDAGSAGLALAAAGAVAISRVLVQGVWSELRAESARSNAQVLSNLQPLDLLWVSFLPGIGEELLFRGALLPAIGMNPAGVLVSGAVFGALHASGGRSIPSAIWASGVGVLYGALAVATHDMAAPVLAHSLANLAAASVWKLSSGNRQQQS